MFPDSLFQALRRIASVFLAPFLHISWPVLHCSLTRAPLFWLPFGFLGANDFWFFFYCLSQPCHPGMPWVHLCPLPTNLFFTNTQPGLHSLPQSIVPCVGRNFVHSSAPLSLWHRIWCKVKFSLTESKQRQKSSFLKKKGGGLSQTQQCFVLGITLSGVWGTMLM